jgi:hypothetical protein
MSPNHSTGPARNAAQAGQFRRWALQTFVLEENRGMSEKATVEGKSFYRASMGIDTICMPHTVS